MKRTGFIRLGGLAAMASGVLYAVQSLLALGGIGPWVSFVLFVLSVMALIVALHLLQKERYGYEGALASASAFLGVALTVGAFVLSQLGIDTASLILLVVGLLVATIGIIALGIFTLDAGVLPRWGGAALIAGNPLVEVLLFFGGVDFLFGSWPVVVPWVVVGSAVFRAGGRQTQQPSRVR